MVIFLIMYFGFSFTAMACLLAEWLRIEQLFSIIFSSCVSLRSFALITQSSRRFLPQLCCLMSTSLPDCALVCHCLDFVAFYLPLPCPYYFPAILSESLRSYFRIKHHIHHLFLFHSVLVQQHFNDQIEKSELPLPRLLNIHLHLFHSTLRLQPNSPIVKRQW